VDTSSMEGQHVGHFLLRNRLGRGAMGEVYLAQDESLDRPVAIKLLRDTYAGDAEFVKRFQQEARAAARLTHPNIVQVYAVDVSARPPYMVMQYVEGHPLDALIGPDRRIPLDRALIICGQTAAALACAHRAGIIHRDIKPGNILIDSRGHVRVSDFGIAKVLNAHTQLTTDNRSLGSPAYMSPEQCRGETVIPGSDLFSLGITLYEMLTGRLPWFADTPLAVMKKIVEEPLPAISDTVQVPAEIELFLETLTAKEPNRRYESAAQVIADIQAFRAGQPMPNLAQLNDIAARIGPRPQVAMPPSAVAPGGDRPPASLSSNWYRVSAGDPAPPGRSKTLVDDLLDGTDSAFTRSRPPQKTSPPWAMVALALVILALIAVAVPLVLRRGQAASAPPEHQAAPAGETLSDPVRVPPSEVPSEPARVSPAVPADQQPPLPPPHWQPGMPLPPGMGPPGMRPPPPAGAPWPPPPHGQPPHRGQRRPPAPPPVR
jgi:serine/threonine-protein kinase